MLVVIGDKLKLADGEEVIREGRAVGSGERLCAVVDYFNVAEVAGEERTEVETREEVNVVALEQVPGSDETAREEGQRFEIRNGEEGVATSDAGNFAQERDGVADMFKDFDGDDGVELGVGCGEVVS